MQRRHAVHLRTMLAPGVLICVQACAPAAPAPAFVRPDVLPRSEAQLSDECPLVEPVCMPSKDAVLAAMAEITPAMTDCLAHWTQGTFQACIVFSSDGSVSFGGTIVDQGCEHLSNALLSDPRNLCLERVMRSARVPPFQKQEFRISYPFRTGG